jgi:glycosyltransferase involved in cell wall biosynthesis
MKIAILYEILGRSNGGIEAWIYHSSEELLKQNHKVDVFCSMKNVPTDSAPNFVKIINIPPVSKYLSYLHPIKAFYLKNHLRDLKNYDFVWARSFTMALAASLILGRDKVVYINASPWSLYGQVKLFERIKKMKGCVGFLKAIVLELIIRIAYQLEKTTIKRCKNVFLSDARKTETLKFFKLKDDSLKFFVVPAGVNIYKFSPNKNVPDFNKEISIISVCRLSELKNIQCVLKAVEILKNKNLPIKYTVVGEGFYEKELKMLSEKLLLDNVVKFVGRQENVEEWYNKNHIFVLPSLYEGFGSVYIEAMACGLPCIAISNKSGKYSVAADEIIDHNKNGFLMKENNSFELAELIEIFIKNPTIYKEFSESSANKSINIFSWHNAIQKLLNL